MAQKEAIAWGVARDTYNFANFELFEITTERGRKVWGRDAKGEPSNRASSDVFGRFKDRETAEEALRAVRAVSGHHAPLVKAARDLADKAERDRREAIERALSNFRASPVNALEPHR